MQATTQAATAQRITAATWLVGLLQVERRNVEAECPTGLKQARQGYERFREWIQLPHRCAAENPREGFSRAGQGGAPLHATVRDPLHPFGPHPGKRLDAY